MAIGVLTPRVSTGLPNRCRRIVKSFTPQPDSNPGVGAIDCVVFSHWIQVYSPYPLDYAKLS